jgi:hypothetical protein
MMKRNCKCLRHVFASPETKSYAASAERYKKHARNKNNLVYASWLFHQYFDGLNTDGNIPCLLIRPEKVYTPSTFVFKGRRRIEVLMDFTTEAGLQTIMSCLNEGCELVNPKQLRTYIYANDADLMCHFFQLKHGETAEK